MIEKNKEIQKYLEEANQIIKDSQETQIKDLNIYDYLYNIEEAVKELDLDSELINHLIEDYVTQIIKTKDRFSSHINSLRRVQNMGLEPDFEPLRELAHKNLGVARNLRIKDGQKLLEELMKKDDLAYLSICVEVLEACTIRLNPSFAYNAKRLLEIKRNL